VIKRAIFLVIFFINSSKGEVIKVFLAGDVMTGRGIDQILPHPVNPKIYESFIKDARDYVELAEKVNGKIPRKVTKDYIWGDALKEWELRKPQVKIINLETSVTKNEVHMKSKGINYRMHPKNVDTLTYVDIVTLANNHILDWENEGLLETLSTLKAAGIKYAGAGENLTLATAPAVAQVNGKRILVFSLGLSSSGVPSSWQATKDKPGVYFLDNLGEKYLGEVRANIAKYQKVGDIIIVSIHWGGNWGYAVPESHQKFARGLIDSGVDLIHGHSSHHPRPIEIYKGKPIFYGLGDFINDYEGISGYENFRGDLTLMYFVEFDAKKLRSVELVPMQIKKFKLNYASILDLKWIHTVMARESAPFGTKFEVKDNFISIISH